MLGGWITRERDLLFDHICRVAAQLAPGSAPVLLAELGDDAALLGAASVARQLANGSLGSSGKGTLPVGSRPASEDKP